MSLNKHLVVGRMMTMTSVEPECNAVLQYTLPTIIITNYFL